MLPIGDESEPGTHIPFINLAFILLNIAVFVLLQIPSEEFTYSYSAVPREITTGTDLIGPQQLQLPDGTTAQIVLGDSPDPVWLTLLTSIFMHGGIAHILGNMLFLFVFGDNVERRLGSILYLAFYLVCGVVASLAHVMSGPNSIIPSLGASGAISGVLAAYLLYFPQNRVRVLVGMRYITEVPAILMIGLWALLQFVSGIGSIAVTEQTGGVAYWAHIGGFVAGLVLAFLLRPVVGGSRTAPYVP